MTLIDPPEVVRFIKEYYPDVICLKPDFTFWQGCLKKGVPTRLHRWCCQYLKHSTKANKAISNHRQFIAGIRAEESANRKNRGRISINKESKVITFKPVFEWSTAEVWEYIKGYTLSYPSLYDEGFGRIGCIVCPFLSKNKIVQHKKRWPNIYRILDIYLNKLWDIHKLKLIVSGYTYEEFMSWPNWKTKEQRKQLNMDYVEKREVEVK
jgi:phosphoadenosine phosphosulfate reductase